MKLLVALLISMISAGTSRGESRTIEDRVGEFGETVRARLAPKFEAAGVRYPPARVVLVGLKRERVLEVYGAPTDGPIRFICSYPVLAASGHLGPKLREGDRQVPEGIYRIRELNPNSLFHLSLWLDYPNEFDWARAKEDGRAEPGSEIMIHGDARSRGCLAMGDAAAEDLFVLAALTRIENLSVILAPVDFRRQTFAPPRGAPAWTSQLYGAIAAELQTLPPSDARP